MAQSSEAQPLPPATCRVCNWTDVVSLAAASLGKWAVYVRSGCDLREPTDEVVWQAVVSRCRAFFEADVQTFCEALAQLPGGTLLAFDTKEAGMEFFRLFNTAPVYNSAVYACVYGPDGKPITENT